MNHLNKTNKGTPDKEKQTVALSGKEKYDKKRQERKKRIERPRDMGLWVSECDRALSDRLNGIADEICAHREVKLIRLVGPTCSGKTTAANMLRKRFSELGKRLHTISIDDFYYDTDLLRQMSRQNGKGENIDYDSPDTIDIEELRRFVNEIFSGDSSHCPVFDFHTGRRNGYREYRCDEEDIFLFEGIQVLYPCVSEIFSAVGHPSVEIYIAPQSSVRMGGSVFRPNELRLMRRLVRDRSFRNTEAEFTFKLWRSVRENEEKNIFPFVGSCKYSIDTTMPYEIGVLKPYLVRTLAELPEGSAYTDEAKSMLSKIEGVVPISDKLISEDSLYKEFV